MTAESETENANDSTLSKLNAENDKDASEGPDKSKGESGNSVLSEINDEVEK